MERFKKNDTLTLKIEDLTNLGFGVARPSGAVVFVADAIPGDVVAAKIIKVNSSYYVARVESVISRSPLWVGDRCTAHACKSCAYKNVSYDDEIKMKENELSHIFTKKRFPSLTVHNVIPSPSEKRYRNKAQYPITHVRGEYEVGYFAPKSHRVTPVKDCLLTPEIFSEITEELKRFFKKNAISVYDEESGEGLLRHVYLRRGETTGEILLSLVINGNSLPFSDELVLLINEKFPSVVGILLNINRDRTNVILGKKFITLFGRDYIFDVLCGVRLKISAHSFYQVNRRSAEILYKKAAELAAPTKADTVLDLFSGIGSIGLSMARSAGEVIGVEIVKDAVECARFNARENGITNASFFTSDANDVTALLDNAERELSRKIQPSIVILDPPRSGCSAELIRYVASLSPKRIVYVSCGPKALARDMEIFGSLGYTADELFAVDLFPCTGHVESVVCLTRTFDN